MTYYVIDDRGQMRTERRGEMIEESEGVSHYSSIATIIARPTSSGSWSGLGAALRAGLEPGLGG